MMVLGKRFYFYEGFVATIAGVGAGAILLTIFTPLRGLYFAISRIGLVFIALTWTYLVLSGRIGWMGWGSTVVLGAAWWFRRYVMLTHVNDSGGSAGAPD